MKAMLIKLINTKEERAGSVSEPGIRLRWTKLQKQAGARTEIGSAKANAELFPLAWSDLLRYRAVGPQLC